MDKLIVMDNVCGLADKSGEFSSFLTVARKFGYSCISIFHFIYLEKPNWRLIDLITDENFLHFSRLYSAK